jgi:hypothetical protein
MNERFSRWIKSIETGFAAHPQGSRPVLEQGKHEHATQAAWLARIILKHPELVSVVAVNSLLRGKPDESLIILNKLPVEENRVAWRDADGDVILRDRSRRRTLGGQIYLDPFHVGLAQAHHHETGKKKKHDVDERNDFNTRPLFWNR